MPLTLILRINREASFKTNTTRNMMKEKRLTGMMMTSKWEKKCSWINSQEMEWGMMTMRSLKKRTMILIMMMTRLY
jgi:hypothetical protein